MFKTNSEKIFLAAMLVISIIAFGSLSGCALLDKLRGGVSPHTDMLIEVPVVEDVEDIRG